MLISVFLQPHPGWRSLLPSQLGYQEAGKEARATPHDSSTLLPGLWDITAGAPLPTETGIDGHLPGTWCPQSLGCGTGPQPHFSQAFPSSDPCPLPLRPPLSTLCPDQLQMPEITSGQQLLILGSRLLLGGRQREAVFWRGQRRGRADSWLSSLSVVLCRAKTPCNILASPCHLQFWCQILYTPHLTMSPVLSKTLTSKSGPC